MSWLDAKGSKTWTQETQHKTIGWWEAGSQPVTTLVNQDKVTLSSFFTNIGKFFLGLK